MSKKNSKDKRLPAPRVSEAELCQVYALAKKAGLPVTTYIREQVLNGQIVINEAPQIIDHATFMELKRIGVNLNQAMRKFNQTGEAPVTMEVIALRVGKFLDAIIEELIP